MKKPIKRVITILCFLSSFCAHSSEQLSIGGGILDLCKKSAGKWSNLPNKFIKEYPGTALCSAVAFPVVAHSLYNKTSIIDTIKTDFNKIDNDQQQNRDYKLLTDLPQDFWAATRLFAYSVPLKLCISKALLATFETTVSDLPPQFDTKPSFFVAAIAAPIIEEMIFTYGLSNIIKNKAGLLTASIVTPLLFGAGHYHDNPKKWALLACIAAAINFLHIRNYHASDHNTLAPVFHHMLTNTIAWNLL